MRDRGVEWVVESRSTGLKTEGLRKKINLLEWRLKIRQNTYTATPVLQVDRGGT